MSEVPSHNLQILDQKEEVNECSSRKSSLKDPSDGLRASYFDRRDSDTISESEEEYIRKMLSDRRGSFRPQPKGTVPYEVQPSDTLEGIAARYGVIPSELTILNKLSSRIVFPGQIIYIPEKNSLQLFEEALKQSAAASSTLNEGSPKPGHVERVPGSSSSVDDVFSSSPGNKDTSNVSAGIKSNSEDTSKESLRINSKYVTDGEGVVSGVLIVTTNHLIFDPNVSDPLVIEYGMDKYGVEAPMGCIVKAALYSDIFRIKKDSQISGEKTVNVYHSKAKGIKKSKSHEGRFDQASRRYSSAEVGSKRLDFGVTGSNSFQENLSKICESTDDAEEEEESPGGLQTVKNTDDSTTDENKNRTAKGILILSSSVDSDDGPASRKASISDDDATVTFEPISPKKKSNFEKTKHKIHKGFRKLSISDSLFSNSHSGRRMSLPAFTAIPDFKHKSSGAKMSSDKAKSLDEEKIPPTGPTYVNMVEEKPELFAPLDKLIPRPAKSFCDTPLYLCLRMGLPVDKSIPRSNPVVHFGQKMKPEYWFSIPKDNVDSLYHFFLRWCPEKYGEVDNINYEELGYTRIEVEEQDMPEAKATHENRRASWAFPWRRKSKDATEMTTVNNTSSPEDWEFLDYLGSASNTILIPELLTPSTILNEEQTLEIAKHLPARAMNAWSLIYGTTAHGFSLKTMYRKMCEFDSPVLIVIANRSNDIFGALLSSPLKMSDHFYGTGESFLFTFSPEFKVFRWSGENNYFIKGNTDSFMVGSSEGHFGLWLDDDLFRGRTNSCQTFANDPLCAEQDFEVKSLEAWGFV